MCAIKDVFIGYNVNKLVLLSKCPVSNFTALCLRVLFGNILSKLISLGCYVSSFNTNKFLNGIPPMDNNALINGKISKMFLKTMISTKKEIK
jgi:hypothetical protein